MQTSFTPGAPVQAFPNNLVASRPQPPSLQWGIVAALSIVTLGLFGIFWLYWQARFAQRLDHSNLACVFVPLAFMLRVIVAVLSLLIPASEPATGVNPLTMMNAAGTILLIYGIFAIRGSLLKHYNTIEPIGLKLNPVLSLFFNAIYFQYHLGRIAKLSATAVRVVSGPRHRNLC